MVFTSTFRQVALRESTPSDPAVAIQAARALTNIDAQDAALIKIVASEFGLSNKSVDRFIAMQVNPKSVEFEQPKRITRTDNRDGSTFFHFVNSKGQNNDILTIRMRGNTGNIDLRGSIGDKTRVSNLPTEERTSITAQARAARGLDTGALKKLLVWINLYLLTREPMLIGPGIENKFSISYQSPLFPTTIDFIGFFNEVLRFEESGEKPNSRDYSMEFIVERTEPELDQYLIDVITQLDATSLNDPAADSGGTAGGFDGT